MIEALRTHVTNDELKKLRKYGNKITVRPYTLEFSTEVPSHVIRKIFDLFDIWVNNYEIPSCQLCRAGGNQYPLHQSVLLWQQGEEDRHYKLPCRRGKIIPDDEHHADDG